MHLKNVAFFVIAFCLSAGIINGAGILQPISTVGTSQLDVDSLGKPLQDQTEGITQISSGNGSMRSVSDMGSAFDGLEMLGKSVQMLWNVLKAVFLPGVILIDAGAPSSFALAVQIMFNVTALFGIVQFIMNRSFKTFD